MGSLVGLILTLGSIQNQGQLFPQGPQPTQSQLNEPQRDEYKHGSIVGFSGLSMLSMWTGLRKQKTRARTSFCVAGSINHGWGWTAMAYAYTTMAWCCHDMHVWLLSGMGMWWVEKGQTYSFWNIGVIRIKRAIVFSCSILYMFRWHPVGLKT